MCETYVGEGPPGGFAKKRFSYGYGLGGPSGAGKSVSDYGSPVVERSSTRNNSTNDVYFICK